MNQRNTRSWSQSTRAPRDPTRQRPSERITGFPLLDSILDEMLAVRDPWRAEWIDADFKVKNDVLYLNSAHDSNLTPQYSEPLEDCLREDKEPGIDLDYWLKNATSQGLPPKNIPDGDFYYWAPMRDNNSVAGLNAGSYWAILYCDRDPANSGGRLGARAAKIRA